jgi:hypothetical protein
MDRILDWLLAEDAVDAAPAPGGTDPGLALAPNVPNPFFSSTRIGFTVPRSGPVQLAVYDVAGRRVAELVDGFLEAGPHAAIWDGTDATGRRTASGVYLVRLLADGEIRTRAVVRLR